jgi:hypothetical protein
MTKHAKKTKSEQQREKQDRLSQALKDNLRRRKAQAKKPNNSKDEE